MLRIRLLLAWLLMAAIPLQGLAAASMLYCGMGMTHAPAQQQAAVRVVASADAAVAAGHDHSQHGHAAPAKVVKAAGDTAKKLPDAAHKCPVCASCCNLVAITEFPLPAIMAPASQAELAEPFVLIHARPLPVPDKPPRA